MTLKSKKIRKEARRHKLSIVDLENAVESIVKFVKEVNAQ